MKLPIATLGLLAALTASAQPDKAVWDEYGLQEARNAQYAVAGKPYDVMQYRFKDPTGAYAAFTWQQGVHGPAAVALFENYVLHFSGPKPDPAGFQALTAQLPKVRSGPPPSLEKYLPKAGRVPNSERYIVGPASLEKLLPEIPAALAGFDMGAEATLVEYRARSGPVKLALFSYPTPQIARLRLKEFEKLPGAASKRSVHLVAVALPPADPAAAAKLLDQVQYEGQITLNERVFTERDNPGAMLIAIFKLIGISLIPCVLVGLVLGLIRGWFGLRSVKDPMILLHIEDRR